MQKIIFIFLLFTSCANDTKEQTNKLVADSIKTDTVISSSTFIEDNIINQIIDHYKTENNDGICKKEVSDSSISLSFSNNPTKDDDGNMIMLSVEFSKLKKNYLFGDLNNDGTQEIVANISTEGGGSGGNMHWDDLFVFQDQNNKYVLVDLQTSIELSGCEDGSFYPEKIDTGFLVGSSSCYGEMDSRCCPSLNYKTILKFDHNKLVFKSHTLSK